MIKNIDEYRDSCEKNELKHIFILSSPIIVFISKLVINCFLIPTNDIIIVPFRNTNTNLIDAKSIVQKGSFIDRVIKKFIFFSFQGYQLRKKIEKVSSKFILYCDWDNREVLEILNSKKCVGHAYIEEGQLSFNNFKSYAFKKDRLSQWMRLRRWSKNVNKISRQSYYNNIYHNICSKNDSDSLKIIKCFEYVANNIEAPGHFIQTKGLNPKQIIEKGYGSCDQQSNLLITILEKGGFPGKLVFLFDNDSISLHSVCEIKIGDRSIMLDPFYKVFFIIKIERWQV